MKLKALFFVIFIATSTALLAQIPSRTDTTSTPVPNAGHDYIHAPVETVNPANGSLSIRIGVPVPPSRGFTLPFNFAYDSNGVNYVATSRFGFPIYWTTKSVLSQGGWSYTAPAISVSGISYTVSTANGTDDQSCEAVTNYVFQDGSGNRHNLNLGTEGDVGRGLGGDCSSVYAPIPSGGEGSLMAVTSDTWQRRVAGVDVINADGTIYSFPSHMPLPPVNEPRGATWLAGAVADRNGNTVGITSSFPSVTYTDSIGRTELNISSFGNSPDTITVSGLGAPYSVYWTSVAANFTATFLKADSSSNCDGYAGPGSQVSANAVSTIALPNGTQFNFAYDPTYGVLNRITYPTGGYVRYLWGLNQLSSYGTWEGPIAPDTVQTICNFRYDTPAIQDRYVSFDGANEVLHQHFQYSTTWTCPFECHWTSKTTTVTTTDLLRGTSYSTVYTYSDVGAELPPYTEACSACQTPVESAIQYKDGAGNTLRTVTKTWMNERTLMTEQTLLDNNQVAKTVYTYDPTVAPWTDAATGTEEVIEKDDYDYGSGGPGPLLRKTLTTYAWDDSSNPQTQANLNAAHVIDRPSKVTVENPSFAASCPNAGNGHFVCAGVNYGYDAHGNITDRFDWLNATGSSSLHASHLYDAYGNITSTTDPALNTTTYTYADNFADACPSGVVSPTNAYLTGITYPSTNGAAHTEHFSYYCASGDLATATDQNNQTTTYRYIDPLARLTEIDYPATWGTSSITYSDTPGSISIETRRKDQVGAVWFDSVDLYDGIFHQISHSIANGELSPTPPWDRTDTCYDGEGRAHLSVYPYQASSATGVPDCSGAHDSFVYDALGRVLTLAHSDDGTSITTSYTGRATDVKDEGNGTRSVERISQMDALGRLANICEVTTQSQAGDAPSGCNLDISGTGFLTAYSYDPLGNLTSVAQGAQARSFSYDPQSRLTRATNPESGTITYVYDSDSNCSAQQSYNGELISKTDARGIRTCLQYDALHRVTAKSYSDGTPAVAYGYDENSKYGRDLALTIGRRSSESTGGPSPTGSIFSYDELGHVVDNSQCTPVNCPGNTAYAVNYFQPGTSASSYNVLGAPGNLANGAGVTFTYGYNGAGRLMSVSSSLADSSHPGTLLNSITYNAYGSPVSSLVGGVPLTDTRTYDLRGRITSIAVTDLSSTHSTGTITVNGGEQQRQVTPATPGSGTVTISGEEQSLQTCDDSGRHCHNISDSGNLSITVNGFTAATTYGVGVTASILASRLSTQLNASGSPVASTVNGATLTLTAIAAGAGTNYSLSGDSSTNDPADFGASFDVFPSGPTLTGGADATYTADTGTVYFTVNGTTCSASYAGSDNANTVASSLAAQVGFQCPSVTASASGNVVTLTSVATGAYSNYPLSASPASSSNNGFSPPSFSTSASGPALTSGVGGNIYNVGIGYFPNGDIQAANDSVNGNWTYTYDDFNRLNTAVASNVGLGCAEVYDRYGNRLQQNTYNGNCYAPQYTISGNNNRLDQVSYDEAGNVLSDGTHFYVYDAENRIACVDPSAFPSCASGAAATYTYDAEGRRVRKTTGGTSVDYLYDLAGHVIAEMSSSGAWNRGEVYAGSQHVATYANGTTYFTHSDWLGTERVRSDVNAGVYSTWISYPFGEGSASPNPSPNHFTGKQRDSEDGLDYFGARYFSSTAGRFITPDWADKPTDVPYAQFGDPQSLNLYGYVRNNPVSRTDSDGHCCEDLVYGVTGWFAQSAAERGVGAVARDAAIGFVKGVGQSVNTTLALVQSAATSSPGPLIAATLATPSKLQPTNMDQAAGAVLGRAAGDAATAMAAGALSSAGQEGASQAAEGVAATAEDVPHSIPAGPSARPTAAQQRAINEMGNAYGCHTCGAKTPGTKSGNWVGDHQPPTSQAGGQAQVYKPQCLSCSNRQGYELGIGKMNQTNQPQ